MTCQTSSLPTQTKERTAPPFSCPADSIKFRDSVIQNIVPRDVADALIRNARPVTDAKRVAPAPGPVVAVRAGGMHEYSRQQKNSTSRPVIPIHAMELLASVDVLTEGHLSASRPPRRTRPTLALPAPPLARFDP